MEFDDETETEAEQPNLPGGKNTVEHWATVKKMLPAVFPGKKLQVKGAVPGARIIPLNLSAHAEHGPRDNPAHVAYAAAKAGNRWLDNSELTEAEFDKAIADAYGPKSTVICR